jgi:excinuclease UvrABC ATPase subunit
MSLADFTSSPSQSIEVRRNLSASRGKVRKNDPLALVLNEVRSRLGYLVSGLGYLTLDRPTRSLPEAKPNR